MQEYRDGGAVNFLIGEKGALGASFLPLSQASRKAAPRGAGFVNGEDRDCAAAAHSKPNRIWAMELARARDWFLQTHALDEFEPLYCDGSCACCENEHSLSLSREHDSPARLLLST